MNSSIGGIILRSASKAETAAFYEKLGVTSREHAHGGPLHFEVKSFSDNAVLEIYDRAKSKNTDALIIEVPSVTEVLSNLDLAVMQNEIKESDGMRYVYTKDPDGRDVMLLERKSLG